LITLLEANTYEPFLDDENPMLSLLYCGAEHAPQFPDKIKKLLQKRNSPSSFWKSSKDTLAAEVAKLSREIQYLVTTSQAVDIIHGGSKANALPERTEFTVDHRINVGSNSEAVISHITSMAAQIASKYNLTLIPFNGTEQASSITLTARSTKLEPAPVTPTYGSEAFNVLSGVTRALYGEDLLVSPGIMTGNTDTRYYWNVSENIFRYAPGWDKEQVGLGNVHTVDERISVQAHVDTVKWMVAFVRSVDEAKL
jgi:Gly-Xaa carboxypeptidase